MTWVRAVRRFPLVVANRCMTIVNSPDWILTVVLFVSRLFGRGEALSLSSSDGVFKVFQPALDTCQAILARRATPDQGGTLDIAGRPIKRVDLDSEGNLACKRGGVTKSETLRADPDAFVGSNQCIKNRFIRLAPRFPALSLEGSSAILANEIA